MTRLASLQLRVFRHAVVQLLSLLERPMLPGGGAAGNHAALLRQEALVARHVRDFGLMAMLHLEADATAYEIAYAARRYVERPGARGSELRIRDLVGAVIGRI